MATRGQQKGRSNATLSMKELTRREKAAERASEQRKANRAAGNAGLSSRRLNRMEAEAERESANRRQRAQANRSSQRPIPRSVRELMISEAQDARNRGDSQLRTERRGAGSSTRGQQKPAPSGIKDSIIRTATEGAKVARRVARGLGILSFFTPSELGDGTLYKGKTEEEVSALLEREANKRKDSDKSSSKPKSTGKTKSQSSSSGSSKSHTVKSGDTLSAIAQKAGVTLKQLMAANPNIKDANKIRPGQKIKLPKATIKGTGKSIYMNKGGMANCGASVKPAQKSSQGIK
jgi:LysM repeat protein